MKLKVSENNKKLKSCNFRGCEKNSWKFPIIPPTATRWTVLLIGLGLKGALFNGCPTIKFFSTSEDYHSHSRFYGLWPSQRQQQIIIYGLLINGPPPRPPLHLLNSQQSLGLQIWRISRLGTKLCPSSLLVHHRRPPARGLWTKSVIHPPSSSVRQF